jgi:uroporphyrinogen-III synthase
VRLIAGRPASQAAPHLYLAGEDRAADIEAELAKRNIRVRTVTVYKNVAVGYPRELIHAMEVVAFDAVLHFSRRSAENYLDGARNAGVLAAALKPRQLCISTQVAELLRAAGAEDVAVASRPDEASLLALLPPPTP